MKTYLLIVLSIVMILSLSACGSSPESSSESTDSDTSSVDSTDNDDAEYYFKDNTLKIEDAQINITDVKVIPKGKDGNEYNDAPIIVFWYDTTNLQKDETLDPSVTWIACISAMQDNSSDMVNTLEVGIFTDENADNDFTEIKPGGTVSNTICYVLTDEETPVILTATQGMLGDELGTIEFPVK